MYFPIRHLSSSLCILATVSNSRGCITGHYKLERYTAQDKVIESISAIEKKCLPRTLALSAGWSTPRFTSSHQHYQYTVAQMSRLIGTLPL